ncbi:DNA polymerase III subunit gamma and tau, partial [Micromonospora sp. CPCC 205711]|uniref:DNA polymerase III subunit gamma and tau n=1 Tax=Micromonospora sp. CPCC 205547 TaxID=3122400 RepID=UPI002FF1E2EF
MALALYRKYRPRTFAEMIGQEQVTEPLSQALRSGRLNHAYLFSGPRGCGKTSSARILARSLNCEQGPTPEPCGTCGSCRSLAPDGGGSIDVIEIDAASHGGVDDARELREKAFFAPASSRFKIYIIDEAHMVSSAGFNALLKLVEEPPEYVKFIFATTEPEKVLGTIKSRTHHYPFRLFPPKVLRPYLEQLTEAEGVTVEPAVFPLVVRAGGGSMRDCLSVLDQLIAGAGPEGVGYARAAALLGVTDSALIDEMCDALAAGDGAAAYATVDRVAEAGHDLRRFASDLLERLRDLIVLQQVPDAAAKGLIDGPTDQIERMAAQAQRLGPGTLSRCADIVHNGLVDMRGTTAPRLLLELICARMMLPGADDSTGGLLQRLERMERRLTLGAAELPPAAAGSAPVPPAAQVRPEPAPAAPHSPAAPVSGAAIAEPAGTVHGGPSAPAGAPASPAVGSGAPAAGAADPAPTAPATPRRVPPEAVMRDPATPEPPRPGAGAPSALDTVAVRRVWPEVVGKVNRSNKRIAALMRDAVVRDLDGDTLVLTVKSSVLAKMMSDHAAVLTDALYEELGGRWQIRCEVAGERGGTSLGGPPRSAPPRPAPAPTPASAPPADGPAARSGPTGSSGPAVPGAAGPAAPGAHGPAAPGAAGPAAPGAHGSTGPATAGPDANGSAGGGAHGSAGGRPAGPSGGGSNGSFGAAHGSSGGGAVGSAGAGSSGPSAGAMTGSPGGGPVGVAPSTAVGSGPAGPAAGGPVGATARGPAGGAARPDASGTGRTGGPDAGGSDADDDDWPEPARPGGGADDGWPEAARPGGTATGAASADDWPEPARPGGATATATTATATTGAATTGAATATTTPAPAPAAPAVPKPAGPRATPPSAGPGGAPVSSAI